MSNLATIVNNILADSGIDDINVVVTNGSYSNPAWITALSWSKITSTPTTLSGYGITDAVPANRTITINGTAQDLSANRSWSVGTVTSVDMTVPTGFAISGIPITSSGTLALTFAAGYSLPTTAVQSNWTTAYNDSIVSAAVSGTTTKTLTLTQQDGGTITASWTDYDTAPVTSVNAGTGISVNQTTGAVTVTNTGTLTVAGTTNQVLVNGGTAAANGNITLSLPQSIGTSNTPTFGGLVVSGTETRQINLVLPASYNGTGYDNLIERINFPWYSEYWDIGVKRGGASDIQSMEFWLNGTTKMFEITKTSGLAYLGGNTILTSANYNSYAPTLTGTGASGSWGISITGNAATASYASDSNLLDGIDSTGFYRQWTPPGSAVAPATGLNAGDAGWTAFDGYGAAVPNYPAATNQWWVGLWQGGNASRGIQLAGGYADNELYYRKGAVTWQSWIRILNSSNYTEYAVQTTSQSNWNSYSVIGNVVGLLAWKNYGNAHVIFDASKGTSPSGGGVSQTNATYPWAASYPTLMGWNGADTYGVRVDSARISDNTSGNSATTSQTNFSALTINSAAVATQSWVNSQGFVTGGPYLPLSGGTVTGATIYTGTLFARKAQTAGNYTTAALWTESYDNTTTGIAFHISGVVGKFLEMRTNGTLYWNSDVVLHSGNYNSYAPTLTGTGASGTWGINITGNAGSANSTQTLAYTYLGSGSVNVNNSNGAIYRTDSGSGAVLAYAPVLHIGGGDTMWQAQGTYGTSGNGTLYFRQGYNGSWGNWLTMLSSANYTSYAVPTSGYEFGTAFSLGTMFASTGIQGTNLDYMIGVYTNGYIYRFTSGAVASWIGLGSYLPLSGGTLTGTLFFSNNIGTAIQGTMGNNDFWRIYATGGDNAGYLEIATADDGAEPIYISQYSGVFTTLTRRITLLDGSGNTTFPGTVNVSGGINVTGNSSWFAGQAAIALENQSTFARFAFYGLSLWDWDHGEQMVLNGNYVYVSNYLQAGNSLRAPIFYDSVNPGFYLDPNGYSNLSVVNIGAYTQMGVELPYPGANYGNGRIYIRLHPVQGRIASLKIDLSSTWNWAAAFGFVSADVSYYCDGTNLYYPTTTITSATGQALNSINIGNPVIENGYVSIPVYSTNSNGIYCRVVGSPSFDWSQVTVSGWSSVSFPGQCVVNVPGPMTIGGNLTIGGTLTVSGTVNMTGRVNIGEGLTRPAALNSDSVAQARIGGSDVFLYVASLGPAGGYKVAMQAARTSDFASFDLDLQSNGGTLRYGGNEVATRTWVNAQGFVTGGPYLPLTGGTISGNLTINGIWETNISTSGGWSKLSFTASTAWGDPGSYGVLGASGGNEPGVMINNPHIVWNSGNSAACIRLGRSGGVSSGAWYQVATMGSNEFMIAKNADWGNGGIKITDSGVLYYGNTGHRYVWESGTWGINISGNSATTNQLNFGGGTVMNNSAWAGGGTYHGYTYSGGNFRFGFSSTSGVVDVYADGNFYATDNSYLVLHTANYNSYAPTLTGGGASGTWGISITGNAATASDSSAVGGVDISRIVYGDNATKTSNFGDPNSTLPSGFWNNYTGTNVPYTSWWHMIINRHSNTNNNYQLQIAGEFWDNGMYFRKVRGNNTDVTNWARIVNSVQDPYAANMNQYVRTTDAPTFSSNLYISADGSSGYVASRMWLYSHNNYRGAGIYMSGTNKTWFAGTPYTDFEGLYIIARTDSAGDDACAQIGNRRWSVDGAGNTVQTGAVYATNLIDYNNNTYYLNLDGGGYLRGLVTVTGGHYNSAINVILRADENGAGSGQVTLRAWCSEPGVTWSWAGFGYNVTNDGGSPGGFSRINGNFGQAYMRFSEGGQLRFYNTNTSGTRVETAIFAENGSVTFNYGSTFNNNVKIYPVGESWGEGLAFIMPTTSTWGGLRWQRQRAGNDGNWYLGFTALDASDDLVFGANNGGTQVNNIIRMTKAGPVSFVSTVTASAFYESSDRRIKDLVDSNYKVQDIELVKPKLYKKNGVLEYGYYAQDFKDLLPSAIHVGDNGFLNLSYTQVHSAKIAYLEDSIEEIKAKILYLENQLKTKQ